MKKKIVVLFLLLLSIISIIFVSNNDFLYKDEIMKITNIKIEKIEKVQNTIGIEEEYYMENITGIITNGKSKNTEKTKVSLKLNLQKNLESLKNIYLI